MVKKLRVPLPEEFDDIFKVKITQGTKIVRYDPALLRKFLQHPNARIRLLSLMCLNFGY